MVEVPAPAVHNHARWIFTSQSFSSTLQHLEKKQRFDLIHFTEARDALFCKSRTARIGNVNDTYSTVIHSPSYYKKYYNDWLTRWLYYHFTHRLEAISLARLDGVIANSQNTAGELLRIYHIPKERLFTSYKSVEPDFFSPALDLRKFTTPRPPRILFIGGNMQRKGVPDLIRAAVVVLQKIPDCDFWIIGTDPYIPNLQRLCREKGVEQHFHFLGTKTADELVRLFSQVDVFCMPSIVEALGVVFLEAMAAGVPVIGTETGGIPEIIQDGKNGRLVPVHNPEKLAQALVQVLQDGSLQEQYRRAGLETVKIFSVSKMVSELYAIYQTVLSRRQ